MTKLDLTRDKFSLLSEVWCGDGNTHFKKKISLKNTAVKISTSLISENLYYQLKVPARKRDERND